MGNFTRLAGIVPLLLGACVAIAVPLAKDVRERPQDVHGAPGLPGGDPSRVEAAGGSGEGQADAPGEPVPGVKATWEPLIYTGFFTRDIERREIEARGALRGKVGLDAATSQAAVTYNDARWSGDQRRELLAYLREGDVDREDSFTDTDVHIVAQLQTGSGAESDGKLRDETMAVLFAAGFRFSPRKVKPWLVKLELYPGELEDLDAWQREIDEEVTNSADDYRNVDAPEGEGSIYVYVGDQIVASYRGRAGPPARLNDTGNHVAVPTKPGVYRLGVAHTHVTSSWYDSQMPWGAEIREHEEGYQYRWPGSSTWAWATSHPNCTLKKPHVAGDFEGLPEVTRGGVSLLIWNKNDFGPLAWNLRPSDIYVHTTPETEADTALGAATTLTHSHGCIHIDPRERDEMIERGYLGLDILFIVRKYDEHLLPEPIRHDMMNGTGVAAGS